MAIWNIAGLIPKLSDQDLVEYLNTFVILLLTETYTEHTFDHTIKFQEYNCNQINAVKLHGLGHPSGGIIMLTKKSLENLITFQEVNRDNIIKCTIDKETWGTDKDIIILGTYVHPIDSKYYSDKDYHSTLEHLEDMMMSDMDTGVEAHYVIAGDLNSRLGTWEYEQIDDASEEVHGGGTIGHTAGPQTTTTSTPLVGLQ